MSGDDARDKIEMWAMTHYNARAMRTFASRMIGKGVVSTSADGWQQVGGRRGRGGGDNPAPPQSLTANDVRRIVESEIRHMGTDRNANSLKDAITDGFNYLIQYHDRKEIDNFRREMNSIVKSEVGFRFGQLYEMFLAYQINKDKKFERYRNFTDSKRITGLESAVKWVSPVEGIDMGDVFKKMRSKFSYTNAVNYVSFVKNHYENMMGEYSGRKDFESYTKSKKGPPNPKTLSFLRNRERAFKSNRPDLTEDQQWLLHCLSEVIDINDFEKNKFLYLNGWNANATEMEVDLTGHTWVKGNEETGWRSRVTHNLHFGEIKSSVNGYKYGIIQLIRLALVAFKTMELLEPNNNYNIEATLFINSGGDDVYKLNVFDMSQFALKVMRNLKIERQGRDEVYPFPSTGSFKLSYQLIDGLSMDSRMGDNGYGVIMNLPNNKKV